jgi:hypothetical protein
VRPEPALNLAILRIVVPTIVLLSPELWQAPRWAALPTALRNAPEILAHLLPLLPKGPLEAQRAQWLLIVACLGCALGLCSRLSAALVTLAGLRVFGLAQLGGSVIHDMHLFWFSALLATSPCGDALSLDRWIAARRGRGTALPPPSIAYGAPLQAVRALLGVIYFFPGFWKLYSSGAGWIFSDNLRNQLYLKWFQHDFVPVLRVDRWPALLQAGALGVVVFELTFIALALTPRLRGLAACAGLVFHASAQLFMRIPFVSLWACYCVLIDWHAWLRRRPGALPASASPRPARVLATVIVAALLLGASVIQGARGAMQAWPFACYPTFQWIATDAIPDLRIEALYADGSVQVVGGGPGSSGQRSQEAWALAFRLAGAWGQHATEDQLAAYWAQLCQRAAACDAARGARAIRFYAASYSTQPERRGAPPLDARLIGELALPIALPPAR